MGSASETFLSLFANAARSVTAPSPTIVQACIDLSQQIESLKNEQDAQLARIVTIEQALFTDVTGLEDKLTALIEFVQPGNAQFGLKFYDAAGHPLTVTKALVKTFDDLESAKQRLSAVEVAST